MNWKTVGVLGGLGPQATMDFVKKVHHISRRELPARANSGYPPMVVYYCRFPPVLLDEEGKPRQPAKPDPRLTEAARKLGLLADFIVIPSNTPHLFQEDIEKASGLKLLSMTALVLEEVRRKAWTNVGILGLHDPVMYTKPLREQGILCQQLTPELATPLNAAIFRVMEGDMDESCTTVALSAITALRNRDVEGIILGCTEIPLMVPDLEGEDLINPAQLLAEATVRYAVDQEVS